MAVSDPFSDQLMGIKPRASFGGGQQPKPLNTAQQAQFTNTHMQNPSVMKQPQQPASFTRNAASRTEDYGYQTPISRQRAARAVGGGMPMQATQHAGTINWEGVHQVLNGLPGRGGQQNLSHEQFGPEPVQQHQPTPAEETQNESHGGSGGLFKKAASVLTKAPEAEV